MVCPQDCTETLAEICDQIDNCCGAISAGLARTLQAKLLLCIAQFEAAEATPPQYVDGQVAAAMTDTADHEVIPSPGPGKALLLSGMSGTNASSSVSTYIILKKGGVEFKRFFTSPGGGGFDAHGPILLPPDTGLFAANGTTGGESWVSAEGVIIDA